jgi:hypothetical protein
MAKRRESSLPDRGKTIGGCPCGFWSKACCEYVILRGVCRYPGRAEVLAEIQKDD